MYGFFGFLGEDPEGEILGERNGILVSTDGVVGDVEGAGDIRLSGFRTGGA